MSAGPPGPGRSSIMSGNGKRSLTPIASSEFSRFQCRAPVGPVVAGSIYSEGISICYRNRRRQGGIGRDEALRWRRRLQKRRTQAGESGFDDQPHAVTSATWPARLPIAQRDRPPKPLGGLLLPGGADKRLSRAPARADPASACIRRTRGRRSRCQASPRSTAPGPSWSRRTRSRSSRS
jgi:hypothetical protein